MSITELSNMPISDFLNYEESLSAMLLLKTSGEKDAELVEKMKSKTKQGNK